LFKELIDNRWDDVNILKLVRCQVCGEAIYSVDFSETLGHSLNKEIEPVCTRHRAALNTIGQTFFPGQKPADEVT
jgi:hypothetical protein